MARPTTSGPHGDTIQHETTNVHLPLSTSKSGSSGRTLNSVGQMATGLSLPTIHSPRPTTPPNPSISRDVGTSPQPSLFTNTENPTPIPGSRQHISVLPTSPEGWRQDTHRSMVEICTMDRSSFLRQTFTGKFGSETAEALLNAFRLSTQRQQEHAWKALQQWLQGVPITTSSIPLVLQFLRWLRVEKNLASQTIAAYKSALTLPLREVFGLDLTESHFALLMKSLFLEKPPSRPQTLRWDLNKVLRFLRTPRFQLAKAKEEDMLHKCLVLVALAIGNRGRVLSGRSLLPT